MAKFPAAERAIKELEKRLNDLEQARDALRRSVLEVVDLDELPSAEELARATEPVLNFVSARNAFDKAMRQAERQLDRAGAARRPALA